MERSLDCPEFLRLGITISYAIVIALAIYASKSIFIPFYSIPTNILSATVLFYGIFVILTSWIENYLLTQKYQDKEKSGIVRFIIDLGILFLFYYIIVAGTNEDHDYLIPDVYLFVTPLIFLLFTLEDVLRIKDYGDDFLHKYRDMSRNFLFISVIISLSYMAEIYATRFQSFGSLAFYRDLIFACISLALIIIYVVMRWRQFNLHVTHP